MTTKRIPAHVRAWYRKIGRKGGRARRKKLTQWERSRIARLGAEASNAKQAENRAKKTA